AGLRAVVDEGLEAGCQEAPAEVGDVLLRDLLLQQLEVEARRLRTGAPRPFQLRHLGAAARVARRQLEELAQVLARALLVGEVDLQVGQRPEVAPRRPLTEQAPVLLDRRGGLALPHEQARMAAR